MPHRDEHFHFRSAHGAGRRLLKEKLDDVMRHERPRFE